MAKRLIPKTHCIEVHMWRTDEPLDLYNFQDYKLGNSAMTTGAGSLTAAMKIVKQGLKQDYTHFMLSYPVAMRGGPTINTPGRRPLER